MSKQLVLRPQAGPQTDFVNAQQEIVFYGGSVGGGKTWAILFDALKYVEDPNTFLVFFRKTTKQLENTLWPEAKKMYMPFLIHQSGPRKGKFRGKANIQEQSHKITFPSGAKVIFSYMDMDKTAEFNWQGTELSGIYWDEFCHFSEYMFNYLRSRMRSNAKYPSFMRGTMNPDPDHFVLKYLEPFLDEDGFPEKDVAGKTRYFIMDEESKLHTSWSKDELEEQFPEDEAIPYTFIPSTIDDNPKMLELNPRYKANLRGNDPVMVKALLEGNWYYRPEASSHFHRSWVGDYLTNLPLHATRVRSWDLAITEPSQQNKNPDWTAGVRMSKCSDGYYYIESGKRFRLRAGARDNEMLRIAKQDGSEVKVTIPVDAGASGVSAAHDLSKKFTNKNFICKQIRASNKSKLHRFTPFSAAAQNGLVRIVSTGFTAEELDTYLKELEAFQGDDKGKDDLVDATADAFNTLNQETFVFDMVLPDLSRSNPFKVD